MLDELKAHHITYNIDDNNVLRVYTGERLWFECQDVKEDTQALDIIGDELDRLNPKQEWRAELLRKLELDDNIDEKYAKGVYDMALDMAEEIYKIFAKNNDLNDIADTYFPDTEIACYIYDAIKYGKI